MEDLSTAPKSSPVADNSPSEKLKREKELHGFYLSDDPLKQLSSPAKLLAPIGLFSLEDQPDKSKISVIAMLSEIKQVTTKKGDRMAILQIEDLTGSAEGVVFPKSFYRLSDYLLTEVRLLIASAIDKVGREGLISLEEGKSTVNELEITDGMGFERGFI